MKYIAKSKSSSCYLNPDGEWLDEPYKFASMVELLSALCDYYEEFPDGDSLPFDDTEVIEAADAYVVKAYNQAVSSVFITSPEEFAVTYDPRSPLLFTDQTQAEQLAGVLGRDYKAVPHV